MAFEILYQLKTKKPWWLDTILYFTIALLIALIICYFIFSIKISFQEKRIQELETAIAEFGTPQQRDLEKKVFDYQRKINDFTVLLGAHKIPSNVFAFFEENIFPNVRFSSFSLDTTGLNIVLTGESEDTQTLARQLAVFKESEFVKDIKTLSFRVGEGGKVIFNVSFPLSSEILRWK